MGKIMVSKEIYTVIEEAKVGFNDIKYDVIEEILGHDRLTKEKRVIALKAYLNDDGYEVELSAEEKSIEKFKECQKTYYSANGEEVQMSIGFMEGMKWMNHNFAIGLVFP